MKLTIGIRSLWVVAGVFGAWGVAGEVERDIGKLHQSTDPREAQIRQFLHNRDCPAQDSAAVFIAEADQHHLDWRLLPSIAFVESTAGKFALHNNLFGWANGIRRFATRREAIHVVATALAEAPAYKGKDLRGKLWAFNQSEEYRRRVVQIMQLISPGIREPSSSD